MILVDLGLLAEIVYFFYRRSVGNALISAAFEKDEERFERISSSFGGKLFSPFDKKLILYNVADIRKDFPGKEELIKEFEAMELKDSQKKQLYPRLFYHYIDRKRNEDASRYYEMLNAYPVYKNKKDIEMTYDTFVRKGHRYLEDAEKSLKRISGQDLPARERLIAQMYENKGINADAKKYRHLAEKHEEELQKKRRYRS